ncbi:hypothetical protein SAMN04489812_3355 [Microlunatus soli]|uniref:Uncharacterized protein n=1 Tax=Microlunatus soli TaxID=630515 RepID=A0A1H1VTY7_9ACTN|nr:hypothetical protein SAMN04489812_3355 [Microlunatus soli]
MAAQLSTQLPAKGNTGRRPVRGAHPIRTGVCCVLCGVAANATFMVTADAASRTATVDSYTIRDHYSLCQIFQIC